MAEEVTCLIIRIVDIPRLINDFTITVFVLTICTTQDQSAQMLILLLHPHSYIRWLGNQTRLIPNGKVLATNVIQNVVPLFFETLPSTEKTNIVLGRY